MYKDHDTKEEALVTLNSYSLALDGFCPVINKDCVNRCLCLIEKQIREINVGGYGSSKVTKWRSSSPYCIHPFITGEINVQS